VEKAITSTLQRQRPSPHQSHQYISPPQLAGDEWTLPITISKRKGQKTRTYYEVQPWDVDAAASSHSEGSVDSTRPGELPGENNPDEGIPGGPWLPLEWIDGTIWTGRTIPQDGIVREESAQQLLKVRLARWVEMVNTGLGTESGFEEVAVLARMFGVTVSFIHRPQDTRPTDPTLMAQQEVAELFPYIPTPTRLRIWQAVTRSIHPQESLHAIKSETIRRLANWQADPPALISTGANQESEEPVASFVGGKRRVYLVILNDIGAWDMEWCPAWWAGGEILYSRGPWLDMKHWHAALMAMGIGLHGTTQWYRRHPMVSTQLVPLQKRGYENCDVSETALRREVLTILHAMVATLKIQPHTLGWEHRLRWHNPKLNPLGRQYWTERLVEWWQRNQKEPLSEVQECLIVCNLWYRGRRQLVTPPRAIILD